MALSRLMILVSSVLVSKIEHSLSYIKPFRVIRVKVNKFFRKSPKSLIGTYQARIVSSSSQILFTIKICSKLVIWQLLSSLRKRILKIFLLLRIRQYFRGLSILKYVQIGYSSPSSSFLSMKVWQILPIASFLILFDI